MKPFRQIALLTAAMLLLSAAGCGKKEDSQMQDSSSQSTWSMADPSLNLPTLNLGHTTDDMIRRAVVNPGNTARLADAMKRAQAGEKITIGTIGGSITQGTAASTTDERYANRALQWWAKTFPKAQLDFVNAGIGATDSYIGVHRVDADLLSKKPDVVIVEFSVNDTLPLVNKDSYDSIVRRILSQPNNPAVILLFQTQEDGTSLQDVHQEIGFKYDLPMISYKNVVYPEVKAGTLKWSDISPDNIHPNDVGHGLVAQLLTRFIDETYDEADSLAGEVTAFDAEPLTKDIYKDAHMLNSEDITADTAENFTLESINNNFPNNWVTEGNGTLVFKDIEFRNFGVMFQKKTDGSFGKYDVYIDGEKKAQFDGDFTGGWGNYAETQECMRSDETAKHTVEIKPAEGSEDKGAAILALMIA